MSYRKFVRSILGIMVILVALVVGCSSPIARPSGGSMTVSIGNVINARTLIPVVDMNTASYTITGTGPGGTTFTRNVSGTSATFSSLAFGTWTVTINALNAADAVIGSGQANVAVTTGQTATVAIEVVPLAGNGTLSLSVSWTAAQVQIPSIQASLIGSTGLPTSLAFAISGNQGTFSSSTIPAGYQTLVVQLMDNGIPVMGSVEVARIVAGQTTVGTYTFTNVNQPGGSIAVNISPEMAEPIPVSIAGVGSTVTAGASMTATASVGDGTPNVVYVWYLNGVSVATGSSYTFGSALVAGYYRVDVTAFTADGKRAGSSSVSFQASGSVAPPSNAGVAQWARTISSGLSESEYNEVTSDLSGNRYAVGYIRGAGNYDFGNGQTVTGTFTILNSVIVKYNDAGVTQWAKTVTSALQTSCYTGVTNDALGNIYACGYISASGIYNFGNGVEVAGGSSSSQNAVIVKYNDVGAAQWAKTIINSSAYSSRFTKVTGDTSGNIYAVGYIYGAGSYDFGNGQTAAGSAPEYNLVIVKYNSTGITQWVKTVGSASQDSYFNGVATDASGDILAAGYITGTGSYDFGSGKTAAGGSTGQNTVIVKYNSAGVTQWAKTTSSGFASHFNGITSDSSGNAYAVGQVGTGNYNFGNGQTATGSSTSYNTLIVKYNSGGVAQWVKTANSGTEYSYFNGVTTDPSGNIYAVGTGGAGPWPHDFGDGQTATGSSTSSNPVVVKYSSSGITQWAKTLSSGGTFSSFQGAASDSSGNLSAVGSIYNNTGTYGFGNGVTATGTVSRYNPVIVKYH